MNTCMPSIIHYFLVLQQSSSSNMQQSSTAPRPPDIAHSIPGPSTSYVSYFNYICCNYIMKVMLLLLKALFMHIKLYSHENMYLLNNTLLSCTAAILIKQYATIINSSTTPRHSPFYSATKYFLCKLFQLYNAAIIL